MERTYRAKGFHNGQEFSIDFKCILNDYENKNWVRGYVHNRFFGEKLDFEIYEIMEENKNE